MSDFYLMVKPGHMIYISFFLKMMVDCMHYFFIITPFSLSGHQNWLRKHMLKPIRAT